MPERRIVKADRWKPDHSAASAWLRDGKVLVHGSSITSIGNFDCEPYHVLSAQDADERIGEALLEVLAVAKTAPPPTDLTQEQEKLFSAAGVKSWKKLHEGAVNCHVGLSPKEITIIPTRNERRTLFHLPELSLRLPVSATAIELGKALKEGWARSS